MAFRRKGILFYKVAVEFELFSKINPMHKKMFQYKVEVEAGSNYQLFYEIGQRVFIILHSKL